MKQTQIVIPEPFYDSLFDDIADDVFLEDGVINETKVRINTLKKANISSNFNITNLNKLSMFAKFCDIGYSQMIFSFRKRNELNEIVSLKHAEMGSILPFKDWEAFLLPRVRLFIEKGYMKIAHKILELLGFDAKDFNVSVVKLLLNPTEENFELMGKMLLEKSWCMGPHVLFPFLKKMSEDWNKYVSFPIVFFPFYNTICYISKHQEKCVQYDGQPLGINIFPPTTFSRITTYSKFPDVAFLGMFTNTYLVVSRKNKEKIESVISLEKMPAHGEIEVSTKLNHLKIYREIEYTRSESNRTGEYRQLLIQSLKDCISIGQKGIDYITNWDNDNIGLREEDSPFKALIQEIDGLMNMRIKSIDLNLSVNFVNTNILSCFSDGMLENYIEETIKNSTQANFVINCNVFVTLDKAKNLLLLSFTLRRKKINSRRKFILERMSVGYQLLKKLFPGREWKFVSPWVDKFVRGHNAIPVESILITKMVRESPFYNFLVKMKSNVLPWLGNQIGDSYENIVVPVISQEFDKITKMLEEKKRENKKISAWSFSSPSLSKMRSVEEIVTTINYSLLDSRFVTKCLHLTSF